MPSSVESKDSLIITSRIIYPVLILGPIIIIFTYILLYGIFYDESWWFKWPFLMIIPLLGVWIWAIVEGGYISGKHRCIITDDRLSFQQPLSWIGKRLEVQQMDNITNKFDEVCWKYIVSIHCDDQNYLSRKKFSEIPRLLRIVIISRTGKQYQIDESPFPERKFKINIEVKHKI